MNDDTKISAHCDCGEFSLAINGPPVVQLVCHCADCRAVSGLPYTEVVFFKASDCQTQGQTSSRTMKGASGHDKIYYSCAKCGTNLYGSVGVLNGACGVTANRLSPFKFEAQAHIWTSEKDSGVSIPESALQSAEMPPDDIVKTMLSTFWATN